MRRGHTTCNIKKMLTTSVFLILLLVLGATQAFDWNAMSQHVEAVSAMPESQCALRNLFITDDYQRIGLAFKHLLNVQQGQPGGTHMNWFEVRRK